MDKFKIKSSNVSIIREVRVNELYIDVTNTESRFFWICINDHYMFYNLCHHYCLITSLEIIFKMQRKV